MGKTVETIEGSDGLFSISEGVRRLRVAFLDARFEAPTEMRQKMLDMTSHSFVDDIGIVKAPELVEKRTESDGIRGKIRRSC